MKRPQQRTKQKSKAALFPAEHWPSEAGEELADHVRYVGSPYHKRRPGDYGMADPPRPREDKTQCDGWPVHTQNQALELLKAALSSGMVSNQFHGGWPKTVWAVDASGNVYEAQLSNQVLGEYHGYPMQQHDPFVQAVRAEWRRRNQ